MATIFAIIIYTNEDGLFQMILDLSESFIGTLLDDFWNPQGAYEYDPYGGQFSTGERPLLDYLLNHPYTERFIRHTLELF